MTAICRMLANMVFALLLSRIHLKVAPPCQTEERAARNPFLLLASAFRPLGQCTKNAVLILCGDYFVTSRFGSSSLSSAERGKCSARMAPQRSMAWQRASQACPDLMPAVMIR